jgi:hypothetical protein
MSLKESEHMTQYLVSWSQPDSGCGEMECAVTFEDREDAYAYAYRLDSQVCKAIRIRPIGLTLAANPSGARPKAQRQYVAVSRYQPSLAIRPTNAIEVVGEPGISRKAVGWLAMERLSGSDQDTLFFVVTLAQAKRSYKRAWKQWLDEA